MGSSGKARTTGAKLARENKLRERRRDKQARKDARRLAASDHPVAPVITVPVGVEPSSVAAQDHASAERHADEASGIS